MMSRVSVAMAAYNGEAYLKNQIDSILSQLGQADELVVSYDPSTDSTLQLLQEIQQADTRVKVVMDTGKGVTSNFNNAISHCSGDYIFISDQDDCWADGKYERVMRAFSETGADMVIHNGIHTNPDLQQISEPFFTLYRIGDGKIKNLLKPRYSGCCMAFTRRLANIILPIPMKIDAYDHWLGMVGECFGKITYVDDILLFHRLHDGNVTPVSSRSLSTIMGARSTLLAELVRRKHRERKIGRA